MPHNDQYILRTLMAFMCRPIVSMKHFFLAISPSPPSLQSPLLVQRSILLFAARLAPGSHLAHHSGRWRASIRGSLLSQNFKHRESKRRLKCCQTMIHSAQPRLTLLHQTQFSTIQTIHHWRYILYIISYYIIYYITQIILELPFHQNFPHSTYHSIQYNSFYHKYNRC